MDNNKEHGSYGGKDLLASMLTWGFAVDLQTAELTSKPSDAPSSKPFAIQSGFLVLLRVSWLLGTAW